MSPLEALQALAARLAADGHPLEALKCLEGCLTLSPMPADEAQVRLRAARLLLQHTTNLAEAKQHLQKAQMLAAKLPTHHILKCEVAALLGRTHKYLGEVEFQKAAYDKGLDACAKALSSAGGATDAVARAALQRWACYFHMRAADARASQGDSAGAREALEQGRAVVQAQGLKVEELIIRMFQMQLCMATWDRAATEAVIAEATAALAAVSEGGGEDSPEVQQLKLHYNILQIIYSMRLGHYDQLLKPADADGGGGGAQGQPLAITTMEELLEAVKASGGAGSYEWLPVEAQEGLVALLAASVLRAPGKVKAALAHVEKGLAAVDGALAAVGRAAAPDSGSGEEEPAADAWVESQLHHTQVWTARVLAVLRVLLLGARAQLHLLQSDFAAARSDAAAATALHRRCPTLLDAATPVLHMQAALYAHAVGAWGPAVAHYQAAAAAAPDLLMELQAKSLAALARLAQGGPDAVGEGIGLLEVEGAAGPHSLYRDGPHGEGGYAERVLAQTAGALLRLAQQGGAGGLAEGQLVSEAKAALGKALKAAHNRLSNHQLVTQLLNAMAPARLDDADSGGAQQMLSSSFALAKGMGDLNGQVAALGVLQQVYESTRQEKNAAENKNYLAKKQRELGARLAEAEADAAQHAAVLGWGL